MDDSEKLEMTRLLLFMATGIGLFGLSASAQDAAKDLALPFPLSQEEQVIPIDNLTAFRKKPSDWFGNLFNQEVGTITANEHYSIVEIKQVGSISGPKLWVEVVPASVDDKRCAEGCWVYLGSKNSSMATISSEGLNQLGLPPETDALNYGNFIFTKPEQG